MGFAPGEVVGAPDGLAGFAAGGNGCAEVVEVVKGQVLGRLRLGRALPQGVGIGVVAVGLYQTAGALDAVGGGGFKLGDGLEGVRLEEVVDAAL